jgi:SAM-dependent methyltransferase
MGGAGLLDDQDDPAAIRAGQQHHWGEVLAANPDMFGLEPSDAAIHAAEQFAMRGVTTVLELGAGQGRDTMFLGAQGVDLVALDYVDDAVATIYAKAATTGLSNVTAMRHDVREPLPFADASFDASYSHMLFCMALTTPEIMRLADEIRRVLRPGGTVIYTVRHTGDAHYGTGVSHGDDMFEQGGFIVHFFNEELVQKLAEGFELIEVTSFTEGDLPRRLWRVTMRKPD